MKYNRENESPEESLDIDAKRKESSSGVSGVPEVPEDGKNMNPEKENLIFKNKFSEERARTAAIYHF